MNAFEALRKIHNHPNCRHEVEAQLGEEVWEQIDKCCCDDPKPDGCIGCNQVKVLSCEIYFAEMEVADLKSRLSEWQPIETAPKGSVLTFWDDGDMCIVHFYDRKSEDDGERQWWKEEGVTHWMPLPEPPE